MFRSNLAFALEPEEVLDSQTANTNSLTQFLGLSSAPTAIGKLPRATARRQRRPAPASFKDNYSGNFRLFRVY